MKAIDKVKNDVKNEILELEKELIHLSNKRDMAKTDGMYDEYRNNVRICQGQIDILNKVLGNA